MGRDGMTMFDQLSVNYNKLKKKFQNTRFCTVNKQFVTSRKFMTKTTERGDNDFISINFIQYFSYMQIFT